eukprot:CAMPEP_0202839742 /NCGR_PEP_ID=MMETSP1389-20130828/53609_1 /ASSEMBLY_ACC=CAM_ASM_000865 /TAXON_ID=302021 /ORGANISM="Rhodomonas sp., Strain CCMP768" /LENGTH=30 /DNA_ID= /DNA_START= /DNA_END= /DNA_ORIENTATION=
MELEGKMSATNADGKDRSPLLAVGAGSFIL